jgi:hypothetical protein
MNQRRLFSRAISSAWLLSLLVFSVSQTLSQQDDPNRDNTLGLSLPARSHNPHSINIVTDASGYDNFDLGVDFSEPHLVSNPRVPTQYINAWNINSVHHASEGYTWATAAPSFGVSVNGDPVLAYDSLGNVYYENMFGGITGCKVIKSTNNGQTWSAAVTSIAGVDKNWIAADQTMGPYANYVYTTMTASSGGNFARSTNQGVTWTTTRNFAEQALPGMMVCVGPNVLSGNSISGGCVYVVTNSGSSFAATYTFHVSTDGGATFTQKSAQSFANYVGTNVNGRNSVQNMRTRPYPFITADNSFGAYRGRLYLVYASNNPVGNGNKPDIYCRSSTDQGATWSSAVQINDDPNSTTNHQWAPATWCDKQTGRLYVKWYDTRNCPTSDSTDVYASYSDNGGVTFVTNQKLTTQKFKIDCATCGGGGTPRYQGDYDAITSNQYVSMSVWGDFRAGNFGSYAAYFPDFALKVPSVVPTIGSTDSVDVTLTVPSVKLYTASVKFSASVTSAGSFALSFPTRDSLTSYPDSLAVRVRSLGAANGAYTLTVTAQGPNGTPIHKRSVTINVSSSVPIQLGRFTASVVHGDYVQLNWTTISEINNYGFEVQKSRTRDTNFQTIPGSFIAGHGTTVEPHDYSFRYRENETSFQFYRLKQIDLDGTIHVTDPIQIFRLTSVATESTPESYALEANHPNPFNPTTNIGFRIAGFGFVSLKVFDVLGQEVATLVNENLNAGSFETTFDAKELPSGVYFYRLQAGGFVQTKKLVLQK